MGRPIKRFAVCNDFFDPATQGIVGVGGQGEVVLLGSDLGEPVPGVVFAWTSAIGPSLLRRYRA